MRFLCCLMLIALGGCSLAPSYRTPEMKLPKANVHDDGVYAAFLQEGFLCINRCLIVHIFRLHFGKHQLLFLFGCYRPVSFRNVWPGATDL